MGELFQNLKVDVREQMERRWERGREMEREGSEREREWEGEGEIERERRGRDPVRIQTHV